MVSTLGEKIENLIQSLKIWNDLLDTVKWLKLNFVKSLKSENQPVLGLKSSIWEIPAYLNGAFPSSN